MNDGRDDHAAHLPEDPGNDPGVASRPPDESTPTAPSPTRRYPDDVSDDDRDTGWGERSQGPGRGDDWYLSERPPHHG